MPVDDHPVHESTKIDSSFRYGCNNRKRPSGGYYAPNRVYGFDGAFTVELKWIRFRLSEPCQFDLAETDPGCADCRHKKNPAKAG